MQYTFELATIGCTEPRSGSFFGKGTDTVYVSFSVGIFDAGGAPISQPVANWGPTEVKSGTYYPNLFLTDLDIPDGGSVIIAAIGSNKGGGLDPGFVTVLDGAASTLASAGGAAAIAVLASVPVAGWVAAAGTIAGAGLAEFLKVALPNCDGQLFGTNFKLTRVELDAQTSKMVYSINQSFPGMDSPAGCGDNSLYNVAFRIGKPGQSYPVFPSWFPFGPLGPTAQMP